MKNSCCEVVFHSFTCRITFTESLYTIYVHTRHILYYNIGANNSFRTIVQRLYRGCVEILEKINSEGSIYCSTVRDSVSLFLSLYSVFLARVQIFISTVPPLVAAEGYFKSFGGEPSAKRRSQ